MKLLYFGTVCDPQPYEQLLQQCSEKPSTAPLIFETALLSGFAQNGLQVDILSYPVIPPYPKSGWIRWGNRKERLACGYCCTWLKTINIPVIKQLTRKLDGRKHLKKWLKENAGEECAVLTYAMPPFLMQDIIRLCNRSGVKCFAVVTDLLRDMYMNERNHPLVALLKKWYLAGPIRWQGRYDGYVYLTENMAEVINPEKPYMVMEGIADTSLAAEDEPERSQPEAIMYAGMLEEQYGILKLLDAFEMADLPEAECWLFGSGNAEAQIQARAQRNPRIRFFGRRNRSEILEREKMASLLVNPRSVQDTYTKYSFPSKTIEYMLSGTPLLTTRLPGIPDEYYPYLFLCEDNSPEQLREALEAALGTTEKERKLLGRKARDFIIQNKNANKQTERIIQFLMEEVKQ